MHMQDVWQALIPLFQQPVPSTCEAERKALMRIMGNPAINFDQPILDFKSNRHLEAMAALRSDIVTPVVWDSEHLKSDETKTVLQNFRQAGQIVLAEFIGKFQYPCSNVASIGHVAGQI
jgi:hypothetical protein